MIPVIGRVQLTAAAPVAAVPDLIELPADEPLVVFGRHWTSPSFRVGDCRVATAEHCQCNPSFRKRNPRAPECWCGATGLLMRQTAGEEQRVEPSIAPG